MKIKTLIFFVAICSALSCRKNDSTAIAQWRNYDYSRPMIAEAIRELHFTKSLISTSKYMNETYGILDFEEAFTQLALCSKNSAVGDSILSQNYRSYLKDISSVFQQKSQNSNSVILKIKAIKNRIENNENLGEEKYELILVSNILIYNYHAIANLISCKKRNINDVVVATTRAALLGSYLGRKSNPSFAFSLIIAGATSVINDSIYSNIRAKHLNFVHI